MRSRRFEKRAERPVNRDTFVQESAELGLVVMNSSYDPKPSIRLERGRIVEIDGRSEESFDLIDRYIARYAINAATAEKTMATDSLELARMLVDINSPRSDLVQLLSGSTPAKLCEIVSHLNVVEMMMALQKMRARRRPGHQLAGESGAHGCRCGGSRAQGLR